jgi:hypothetical protein
MPNGRPTQVKHYEGMVIDQSGQRGRYSVCGVLYEVSSRGRRTTIWDYYGREHMAVSRMLDQEAARRMSGEDGDGALIIYDRIWSDTQACRHVIGRNQLPDPQISLMDRIGVLRGRPMQEVPRFDGLHEWLWEARAAQYMERAETFHNPVAAEMPTYIDRPIVDDTVDDQTTQTGGDPR